MKESFIREINFLQEFKNSPYIVHLHDFELTEKSLLMVLEFGETDASKLMRKGRLEPNEVRMIICNFFLVVRVTQNFDFEKFLTTNLEI